MLVAVLLFIVGLVLLIKGGDWFVDGATSVAKRFRVPDLLIGATVVSIGTTLPEVMVSATGAVGGHSEIAYGNAIGSIICNTALIAAITIAVTPSEVDRKSLKIPTAFFYIATAIYLVIAYTTGTFTRPLAALFLIIFAAYIGLSVHTAITTGKGDEGVTKNGDDEKAAQDEMSPVKTLILLVAGAIAIAFGANLLVDNGTIIAAALGVPESVVALTMVALGTSLPELVTAITSLMKGHGLLSLGNIIGANLFNLVLVNGIASFLAPYEIPKNSTIAGINSTLVVDMPVMVFVMSFLVLPGLIRGKLSRAQGIILLLVYAAFCVYQFVG